MQKKFLVIIIIAVLAIAIGGAFLWMQKPNPPAGEPMVDDWKKYSNTEYGFEMKYPKEWFIEANLGGNKNGIYISPESPEDRMAFTGEALSMSIEATNPNITVLQTVEMMFNLQSGETGTKIDFTHENITIGGVNGLKIKTICEGVGCGSPEWLVINNGYLYHFYSQIGYKPTFDQIISTFKFTSPQNQTAGWKTYNNSDIGFSIQYPSEAKVEERNSNLIVFIDPTNDIISIQKDVRSCDVINNDYKALMNENRETFTQKFVVVADKQAIEFSNMQNGNSEWVNLFVPRSTECLNIQWNSKGSYDEDQFYQMVSTFKFTK